MPGSGKNSTKSFQHTVISTPLPIFPHSLFHIPHPHFGLNGPMGSSFTTTGSGVLSLSQAFPRLYKENLSWSNLYLCCCYPSTPQ